ncbi:MAG: CDF family Co(II)/Ni(II) efflux transporter DmeF [Gammaproteobacteria bacterium]|nr:CDF family Co(II)/Ni(II) efflux transporter DmeF [Gammaproteobacteria bacterium]
MNQQKLDSLNHSHSFGQEQKREGEIRTLIVIAITAVMMVIEIVAGLIYGSMALYADGLHMASHTVALGITAFAYIYARSYAHDERYSFGTGKVNSLGGFAGAILLAVFALMMAWESVNRLINPVDIAYNQAILVAVIGLLVNGASMMILGHRHHHHDHHHEHEHHHHDHNLRSAYLHVLADALTSVLAIVALLAAKYYGVIWMDPLMGIVGAILVSRWSLGLVRTTSDVLLDKQAAVELQEKVRQVIEQQQVNRIMDLHVWSIGPGIYAAEIVILSAEPKGPDYYRSLLPQGLGLVHITIEVHNGS